MTSSRSRTLGAALLVLAVLCYVASTVIGSDGVDTALGVVAGMSVSVGLVVLVLGLLERRGRRAAGDQDALDRLEPLRAARRDDR